ncbi:2828_t:CDS:2, partial [Scutellospora calospora]
VKPCKQITIKSKSQDILSVPLDTIPLQGSKIHTLAARKLIQEIENNNYHPIHTIREQIVHLAKSYNLSSKYTSFIAIDSHNIEDHEKKEEFEKKMAIEKYKKFDHEEKSIIEFEKQKKIENKKDIEFKKKSVKKIIMEFEKEAENQNAIKLEKKEFEKAIIIEKYKELERQKKMELKKEQLTKEKAIMFQKQKDTRIKSSSYLATAINLSYLKKDEILKELKNKKLKLPESEPWWKTSLSTSYLKVAAPNHENKWKDKYDKGRKYLSDQIGDADAEKELLEFEDSDVVDGRVLIGGKIATSRRRPKNQVIQNSSTPEKCEDIISNQNSSTPEKCEDIISNQKDDGNFEISKELESSEFPLGDFYIKSASGVFTSTPAQNLVVDIKRNLFVPWGAIKDGTKAIIAHQKSDIDQDDHQLWRHEDGWLINKQTNLCLEVDEAKAGICLSVHHKRNLNKANNQRWILTPEGHIALKSNPKFVIEVLPKGTAVKDGSYLIITNTKSKNFKDDPNSKFIIIHKKHLVDGAFIGVIRMELVSAKDLKTIGPSLTGEKSSVRIFNEDNKIIAQTKFIDNNLNPIWNEIHYLPVKNIGENFLLDVMGYNTHKKDESLGSCHFAVTRDFIKKNSNGTQNGIDMCAKLSTKGQIFYRAKFFSLEPLSQQTPVLLKKNPFNLSTLYLIITLQTLDGSFPPSNTLAKLFGYESLGELINLYKSHCCEDRVLMINQTVWTTSMVSWFLQSMLKEYRNEWIGVYERAEQYISKEINYNLEIEKVVVATGKKAVHERFEIK